MIRDGADVKKTMLRNNDGVGVIEEFLSDESRIRGWNKNRLPKISRLRKWKRG